jgi:hypothetical protein
MDPEKNHRFRTTEETHIRPDTGETYEVVVTRPIVGSKTWSKDRKEQFVKGDPARLAEVRLSSHDWRVYWTLVDMADFETGVIIYRLKDLIVSDAPTARVITSRAIKTLTDMGLIRRVGRAEVQLNPQYVWRGSRAVAMAAYRNGESEDD